MIRRSRSGQSVQDIEVTISQSLINPTQRTARINSGTVMAPHVKNFAVLAIGPGMVPTCPDDAQIRLARQC